jgi:hypothetical protein
MSCELNTKEEVKTWLLKPENQVRTDLFVVVWEGHTPAIAVSRLKDLEANDELAEVILIEHRRRKRRPDTNDNDMEISDE